jgi:hypothetical protein
MEPPRWAQHIIRTVARQHRKRPPKVTWRSSRQSYDTSGNADGDNQLFINAGRSQRAAKLTLLHELAHWLLDADHTHKYWLKVWQLYRQFHVPIGYALRAESHYRRGALTAYWASRDRRGRRPASRVKVQTMVDAGPPPEDV